MPDCCQFEKLVTARLKALDFRKDLANASRSALDKKCPPISAPRRADVILAEINAIPSSQHLLDYREFSVYYAFKSQAPETIFEIARLRELTYRELDEGSGQEIDTDSYDDTYTHLFIFDRAANKIVGAYRFGQTDMLVSDACGSGLYLWQMFDFSEAYKTHIFPALEMGRSFIAPEYQRRAYGLFLLWKGIGVFLIRHPRYRTLYGTVSLSLQYHPLSISLMEGVLTRNTNQVATPFDAIDNILGEPLENFLKEYDVSFSALSEMVQLIELDGKSVPVMLKQYHRVGAKFYCVGVDKNFSGTPGFLLDVYMPEGPAKNFARFFDKNEVERYQLYGGDE